MVKLLTTQEMLITLIICEIVCGDAVVMANRSANKFNSAVEMNDRRELSSIQIITFKNCRFNEESTLQKAYDLRKLIVSNNQLSEIPAQLFFDGSRIELADFSENQIKYVQTSDFVHAKGVLNLDLSYNRLANFDGHPFDELTNLKVLNLSNNPIDYFETDTFARLTQLEHLTLKRTGISSIRLGIFLRQHKLISLDLSANNLKSVDFEQFLPIFFDLQTLNQSENQLTDLDGFRNAMFPQLTLLDIRSNRFNCSYLRHFVRSIDWAKLRMPMDPQSGKIDNTSVHGIECNNNSPETSQPRDSSYMDGNANQNEITPEIIQQLQDGMNFMKLAMVCSCVIIFILFAILLKRINKK